MKRLLSIAEGLLGLLILGALAIMLTLTFGGLQADEKPASQDFQSPIETPTPPGTPATPTVAPTPVPCCSFAARSAAAELATPLEAYRFSEPRVVLTHTSATGIAGWLPDNQRLLITRLMPEQSREYVEIFNVQTGELQRYGERHSFDAKAVWLTTTQAVAFVDVSSDRQVVLRISRGESGPVEEVVSGLAAPYLAASPDGRRVVFFTQVAQNRPEAFDATQAQRQTFPVTLPLTSWQELSALGQQYGPEPYRATWSPSGNQIAFYNDTGLYLFDLPSGQICEVGLGFEESEAQYGKRWTFYVQWSPNGRYLAALSAIGDLPVHFIDLILIDMNSGERRTLSPGLDLEQHYVYDFGWAANNQQLITLAQTETIQGRPIQKLYLIDVQTGDSRQVMPEYVFGGGTIESWQLAWAPNGQTLAVKCPTWFEVEPTILEDRICLISVTLRP